MEISRVADIDNAQVNNEIKAEKVQELDKKDRIVPEEQYKNNSAKDQTDALNEVVLDNVKFGYNTETKDFFVKVVRGDIEYKYPTEDMMKVKAHLNDLLNDTSKS